MSKVIVKYSLYQLIAKPVNREKRTTSLSSTLDSFPAETMQIRPLLTEETSVDNYENLARNVDRNLWKRHRRDIENNHFV